MTKTVVLADTRSFARRMRRYDRDLGREFDRELRGIARDVRDLQRTEARQGGGVEAKAAASISAFASTGRAGTKLRNRGGYELGANFGSYRFRQFRRYSPDDDFMFSPVEEHEARIQRRVLGFLKRFADDI